MAIAFTQPELDALQSDVQRLGIGRAPGLFMQGQQALRHPQGHMQAHGFVFVFDQGGQLEQISMPNRDGTHLVTWSRPPSRLGVPVRLVQFTSGQRRLSSARWTGAWLAFTVSYSLILVAADVRLFLDNGLLFANPFGRVHASASLLVIGGGQTTAPVRDSIAIAATEAW